MEYSAESEDAATNRLTDAYYGLIAYDASGNLTMDYSYSYTYDGESRLASAYSGSTANYTYDAHNHLVKKVAGSTTTVFIYAKQLGDRLIAEYVNGALQTEYIYFGGQLVASIQGTTTRYHHSDHLSVRLTTDSNGAVIGRQGHYPFGERWYQSGVNPPFLFTNYYRDSSTGLDYAVNRFYSYRYGRFESADLVDLTASCPSPAVSHRVFDPQKQVPGETNLYAYVVNDPANRIDPSGLDISPVGCTYVTVFVPPDQYRIVLVCSFPFGGSGGSTDYSGAWYLYFGRTEGPPGIEVLLPASWPGDEGGGGDSGTQPGEQQKPCDAKSVVQCDEAYRKCAQSARSDRWTNFAGVMGAATTLDLPASGCLIIPPFSVQCFLAAESAASIVKIFLAAGVYAGYREAIAQCEQQRARCLEPCRR